MIEGSLVPNITFFKEDGSLDEAKTKWHIKWMFDKGVDGLFITGSYGSGPMMSKDERVRAFEISKEVADQYEEEKTLIAQTGCIDVESTVYLSKKAEEIGMDLIGVVPPFYYKVDDDQVYNFYKEIMDNVDIPVFAYNNPNTTRYSFDLDSVNRLQKIGLKGVKDSSMSTTFLTRVFYDAKFNNKDFQLLIGTSTGWLPYYDMGIKGMIAGMCNYAPEIIVSMYNWTVTGEREKAERAYKLMKDLGKKIKFTNSTIVSHMALYARGFEAGYPRKPFELLDFDSEDYKIIEKEIKAGLKTLEEIKEM